MSLQLLVLLPLLLYAGHTQTNTRNQRPDLPSEGLPVWKRRRLMASGCDIIKIKLQLKVTFSECSVIESLLNTRENMIIICRF